MKQLDFEFLGTEARRVLDANFKGQWTQPAPGRYPHQWLWDSAFIAIGLRHYDVQRAASELTSLLRGQWANGMMPNMIYAPTLRGRIDAKFWDLKEPRSISKIPTSPITQPPILAVAVELVAEKLSGAERKDFLIKMLPALISYHEWMYRERMSDQSGLITLVHPWESGLDNTPPWMNTMKALPKSINLWGYLALIPTFGSAKERTSASDAARMLALAHIIYTMEYDNKRVLRDSPILIQDLGFNSILVAANASLVRLCNEMKIEIIPELATNIDATKKGIELLWDADAKEYYSRNAKTGELIKDSTVATFMPIFAKSSSTKQRQKLMIKIDSAKAYRAKYGLPSVSRSSSLFSNNRYWQGPMWVNMNWFIIRGLEAAGETERAKKLTDQTLEAVQKNGIYEYFDPDTGKGYGAKDFSWTAALILDLLAQAKK